MTTYGAWTRGVKSAMRLVTGALLSLVMAVTLGLAGAGSAEAATSGPKYPGAASGTGWSNVTSTALGGDDSSYAYNDISAQNSSGFLYASNFGFAIPAGATINGITVVIGKYGESTKILDDTISLSKDGGTTLVNNLASASSWSTSNTSITQATYGSTTNLWGASWSATEINSQNFTVALKIKNTNTYSRRTAYIDYIQVTVTYTPDTTAPTVSSVTSSLANGSYSVGQNVPVTVTFSEAVTVTGTPTLTLETGTTDRTATYSSGSGTTTLTFNYTVQAGDTSADLNYTSTSALALNSGTIKDAAGNNATLTLPTPGAAGSLGANKAIVIDTTAPTVTVNQATNQSDPPNGPTINFTVVFSESVTGFTKDDVTISGTAGGTKTVDVTGSGSTYNVAVSGMTSAGTVIATINANAASDAAGNSSEASTSTDNTVTLYAYTITAAAGLNGSISSSGATTILSGGSQTYTITPNSGYLVADVLVDSESQGAKTSYTFSSISDDHTIAVTFVEQSSPTVTGLTYDCAPVDSDTVCTFTSGTGTFSVPQNVTAQVLVVGGGGGGGGAVNVRYNNGGGGGAGGFVSQTGVNLTSGTSYTVKVGGGGSGGSSTAKGSDGADSQFGIYSAAGGGGAGSANGSNAIVNANGGGSGGGGGRGYAGTSATAGDAGAGTSLQGNSGAAASTSQQSGGGGGAGSVGLSSSAGGAGTKSSISGTEYEYACGGGGAGSTAGSGGCTGAGAGVKDGNGSAPTIANRGHGGGGGGNPSAAGSNRTGGAGGSGVVIIRFPKLSAPVTDMVTSWPTASAITYGQTLASSTLTGGTALVTGSFAFSAPATVPPAGTANYNVTFTPSAPGFGTATGSVSVTVNAASQTITVSNSATYDGSPKAATVTCSGGGTASNIQTGGAATQTNAGDYSVTADCPANGSYAETKDLTAANKFTIAKATPTASISNTPVTYSGSVQTATVACLGGGTASLASGGTGINAGSYPATVNCVASGNYAAVSGLTPSNGDFVIDPAPLTITANNDSKAYGTTKTYGAGSEAFTSSGLVNSETIGSVTLAASGGTAADAALGSYDLTPSAATGGTFTATNYTITYAKGTLTVGSGTPTVSVDNSPQSYSGSPIAATVTCSSGGAVSNLKYDGSLTAPTNAGTYAVTADCAANGNYAAATGLSAGDFTISTIAPTVSVGNSPQSYTGSPLAATVTCSSGGTASNLKYDGSSSVPTNAGTYAVTADCAANGNYSALVAAPAGSYVIGKASSSISVTGLISYVFETLLGQGPATADVTGSTGAVSYSYAGTGSTSYGPSATRPTDAGTYSVTATVAADANHDGATSGAYAFTISAAAQTLSVTNSATYDGSGKAATVSCSGGGTASNILTGGSATQTAAGSYTVTADCGANGNFAATSGLTAGTQFTIAKGTPTASVTNTPVTYSGSEQTATVSCLGGGTATLASGGTGTNAGSYAATVDCAASDNYVAATGLSAGSFVIAKATPTASITNTPVSYSGSAQTATVACLGGGTASLASGGTGTNVGSYPSTVDCAESTNYAAASGLSAGNFVISAAAQTLSVTNSATYDGTAKAATVTCSGGGTASSILTGGAASQTAAGSYTVTADCPANGNYAATGSLTAGTQFTIAKATPTASLTNTPVTYSGSAQSATAACLGGGTASLASGGTGTNAGSYAATINCAESSNYAAASGLTPTNGSFVITKATPAVTAWPTAAALSYGDTLVKSALTGGTATPAGAAGLFAWTVPTTQPPSGTTTQSVTFTPTDTDNYTTVRNNVSVTVGKGAQAALTITAPDTMTYGDADAEVSVSGGSGTGATSYVVTGSTACSLVSGKLHVTSGTGTCTITATKAADNNYSPQSGTKVVAISKAAQATLAITAPASATFGAADAAITTTGGTGTGAITFSAGSSTGCAIVGGKLHVTAGNGTCALTAIQAADSNYAATTSDSYTVTLDKAESTISVTGSNSYTYNGAPQGPATISRTGSTGAVTYSYIGTGSTSYEASATAPTNAGSYSATASVAADGNYAAKTSEAVAFTIAKKAASVTPGSASKEYHDPKLSDPPLTGILSGFVDGDKVTATYSREAGEIAGSYTISVAAVTSDPEERLANYTVTTGTAEFVIAQGTQTVSFDAGSLSAVAGGKTFGDSSFTVTATSDVGGAITYSSLTSACSIDGNLITIEKAGTCTIRATQAGVVTGGVISMAPASADLTFTVAKANATVALDGLTVKYTAGAQTPTVTTDPAGKAVTVTYNGSTTAPSAVGSYTVVATIADDNYTGSATDTFTIDPADPVGVTISKAAGLTDLTNSATLNFDVVFTAAVTGVKGSVFTVTAAGSPSVAVTARSATEFTAAVTGMGDGEVAISLAADQVSGLLNNKNSASNSVTVTYDGTAPTITWTNPASDAAATVGSYTSSNWAVGGQRDGETGFVAGTAVFQKAAGGLNLKTNSFTCDTRWTDVAVKASGASVDLAAGNCYRWTFDPTASALAVKPADAAGNVAANLTSAVLKVDQVDSTTTVAAATDYTTSSAYGGGIKYAATVSAGSDSLANKELTFYANGTTLIGSCTITSGGGCTMTDPYAGLAVGSHKITAVFPGSDNYRSSTSTAATHTVAKAAATCTVSGWTGPYDGKGHGASGSCTGVGGATLTGLSLGSSFVNANARTVDQVEKGELANWSFTNANYEAQSGSVDIIIRKASVTVTPNALSKTYADPPLPDPVLTYTTDPPGVSLNGALSRYSGNEVGPYDVTIGTLASPNYTITLDGGIFSIIAATDAVPAAAADSYKVDRGQTLTVAAPGLLANDTATGGYAIRAILVSAPAKALAGGFTLNADGSFTYAHDPAKTGNDSFTYKVTNGSHESAQAVTVTLTVFTASQADQEISIAPDRVLVGAENPDAEGCGPPVTFTVANAGAALNISGVALEDTDTSIYRISANDCAGTLAAAGSCQVEVKYCPGTSTAPKPGRLVVRSSDPETPALAAFLSNYEDAATTASRSLPPVMESLAMPEQITAGVKQAWTWSTLGYGDTYQMFFAFYECKEYDCTSLATLSWRYPTSIDEGSYDFTGMRAKRFNYSTSITPPLAWKGKNVVVRFFQRSRADAEAGLSGISQIIPGGLVPVSDYYDNSGRFLVRPVQ